ncbi:MAG: AMP-binding protein [Halobacteriovoraceae bacterium]|nr:AMP-binding protein [Halobacteriovoraceae bacterium]MCB9093546.1 AMP-binding protein [Halobacteriovoraceae bacterium]
MTNKLNVAHFIAHFSAENPSKQAVVVRKSSFFNFSSDFEKNFQCISFDELDKRSNVIGNSLESIGITRGTKTLVFVPPGFDFPCIVFALFKIGAVPVFIDPGMGTDNLLKCIEEVGAEALIGISKIHMLRQFKKRFFKNIKILVNVDGTVLGSHSLKKIIKNHHNQLDIVDFQKNELAAILFTSGGTGTPKGVEYTMEMFVRQTFKLKEMFMLTPEDRDYPGFPLFSLFTLAMGMTVYIPEIDASKPSQANPKKVIRDIEENSITFAAGSPSIWKNVADYSKKKKVEVTCLKSLAMFGAPVDGRLIFKLQKIFPNAAIYTPYGATECLPVALISSSMILGETKSMTSKGSGVCVGYPVKGVEIQIIAPSDEVINDIKEAQVLSTGDAGEIIVRSDTATRGYYGDEERTKKIRIADGQTHWHRMGDMGYLDDWGRLWFLGRKDHSFVFETQRFYPASVEAIFNEHPDIENTALIQIEGKPALAVIRKDHKMDLNLGVQEKFFSELEFIAKKHDHTEKILRFMLFEKLPVDTRHNIKIDRIKLGEEAKARLSQKLMNDTKPRLET